MNIIKQHPINEIGYNFIEKKYIPKGKDEYHLRNQQNNHKKLYHALTNAQIDILIRNRNTSDNWSNVLVSKKFDPSLVKNSKFFGLVRIGKIEPICLEFHDFKIPAGIYNSTIISSDIGDNVCIENVNYLSHYIIEDNVILVNINELATTNYAKFGNGILKEGEVDEKQRMIIEVCNENGGRSIIPYNGMLAGDAYMWSKYRDDKKLLQKFKDLTEKKFDKQRGYYGKIGQRTIIKNTRIIKDVLIGSDAYIKGANKLKNLTINSDGNRKTQIGEGCELVNGIIGYGCRIFYGVKAVRFITASHSQLKYGARLINSYLGNNSTISCCEVLNTMIFPGHEQHHNNSFLCASLIMGQSNIAAGATIGSNHNTRGADGEIVAGRGFWPGLCVSLKHNSKFASFAILAKGDYPSELNIPAPFCLINNDVANDRLVIMPAYWFMYNMYALERNVSKYHNRDKREYKIQNIEYDYLAPDTINEVFDSLKTFSKLKINDVGEAVIDGWENAKRKTVLIKLPEAIKVYEEIIQLYACTQMLKTIEENKIQHFDAFKKQLHATSKRSNWLNIGGQLILEEEMSNLKKELKSNKIKSWDDIHAFYQKQGKNYDKDNLSHSFTSLLELWNIDAKQFTPALFKKLLQKMLLTKEWMTKSIYSTREKDYSSPYRKMVYDNNEEMLNVIGKIDDNTFIQEQTAAFDQLQKKINGLIKKWKL